MLGLEQFTIPHAFGSSHGSTRIIRLAYSEGPQYVPLLRAAYRYWRELEEVTGESILVVTGGLDIGPPDSPKVENSRRSCLEHGIPFEELDGAEVNRRFPGYRVPESLRAIYQADAGYVRSEVAIRAHAAAARELGAEIVTESPVRGWEKRASGFRVETASGTYQARQAGVHRRRVGGPTGAGTRAPVPARAPDDALDGAPERGAVRAGAVPDLRAAGPAGTLLRLPQRPRRGVQDRQVSSARAARARPGSPGPGNAPRRTKPACARGVAAYFPEANGPTRRMVACMFTTSPDEHFILDRHPAIDDAFIAAGFSGHGYKFCSVIGRIMADFCLGEEGKWGVEGFGMTRWT